MPADVGLAPETAALVADTVGLLEGKVTLKAGVDGLDILDAVKERRPIGVAGLAELIPNELLPAIEKKRGKKDQLNKPSVVVIQGPNSNAWKAN